MLDWQSVSSSNVSEIAYDSDESELHVKFHSGAEYVYRQVPASVFDDFLNAPSKGKFVHSVLKGTYDYYRV